MHAAMAKRFATDACFGVANDALQLLGGYGCAACNMPLGPTSLSVLTELVLKDC